jgi:dolichol-phosphate mannosyltransferase
MLFFIIPAYNEEKNISILLESIEKKMKGTGYSYKLIVVNDGSTDDTKRAVERYEKKLPIILLNHDKNKNVGQVFRTAFEHILKTADDQDIIITKEADNTSDLGILDKMLNMVNNGYDLVLASCYARTGRVMGTTLDRRILSFCANMMIKILFPIRGVHTYSSFYRAYRAGSLRKACRAYDNQLIEEAGFGCMVEMLIKLSRLPLKISEVPMILHCDFRKGKSKMNKWRTISEYIFLIRDNFIVDRKDMNDKIRRYVEDV